VGMDERVSELAQGQEELEDRVVWVEQRGWSPNTWTMVGGKLVAGEEDEVEVDAMEEREEILDEVEAWVRAHPMQEPSTGEE
jgi:8-oxo-dGTP pyrophosphatase MutT (NUDIX family)